MESVDKICSFAACLKQLIASRGIKPSQLAAILHVDDSLVRKWLAGSRVPPLKANYIDLIGAYLDLGPYERLRLKKSQIYSVDANILTLSGQLQKDDALACEHEQSLLSLLHAIPETAFLLDAAGRVVVANETASRRLGLPGNEAVGLDPFLHLAPDVAERRRRHVSRVLATGQPIKFRDKRGSCHILNSLQPVKNSDGKVTKVAVLGMDITELENVYTRLKNSEEQLRLLYEHNANPILLSRPDGAVLAANPAACAFFAMGEEEICAAGRSGLLDPADPNLAPALHERATTGKATAWLTFILKGGRRKPAMVSSAQFLDSAGILRAYALIHTPLPTNMRN